MITYSTSLIILSDLNVHIDDTSNPNTSKLLDVLATHNLVQHVTSPTHQLGHTLDVVITRTNRTVSVLPVDPPLLSDHTFVVAEIDCTPAQDHLLTDIRTVRNWRSLDVNALVSDLSSSELVQSPPVDVDDAFACYNSTLRSLLDKHAPLQTR